MSVKRGGSWCSVYGCRNNSNVNKNISFFRYPRNVERSNAWISATGRRDLITKGTEYAYKNCRVCALHFLEDMFANDLKNRLHSHAVPKILLSPAEIHAAAAAQAVAEAAENEANESMLSSSNDPLKSINVTGTIDKSTGTKTELTLLTPVTFFNNETPTTILHIKRDEPDRTTAPKTAHNDNIRTYQVMDPLAASPETINIKIDNDEDDFDLIQSETISWDSYYKSLQTYYKLEKQHNSKLTKLHAVKNSDDTRNKRNYTKCNICFKRLLMANYKVHMKSHQDKKMMAV